MALTPHPHAFTAEFLNSLNQISAAQWNAIADTDYPFLRHDFLLGLETTGCTTAETGWQPCHLILRRDGEVVAIMPLYLKRTFLRRVCVRLVLGRCLATERSRLLSEITHRNTFYSRHRAAPMRLA